MGMQGIETKAHYGFDQFFEPNYTIEGKESQFDDFFGAMMCMAEGDVEGASEHLISAAVAITPNVSLKMNSENRDRLEVRSLYEFFESKVYRSMAAKEEMVIIDPDEFYATKALKLGLPHHCIFSETKDVNRRVQNFREQCTTVGISLEVHVHSLERIQTSRYLKYYGYNVLAAQKSNKFVAFELNPYSSKMKDRDVVMCDNERDVTYALNGDTSKRKYELFSDFYRYPMSSLYDRKLVTFDTDLVQMVCSHPIGSEGQWDYLSFVEPVYSLLTFSTDEYYSTHLPIPLKLETGYIRVDDVDHHVRYVSRDDKKAIVSLGTAENMYDQIGVVLSLLRQHTLQCPDHKWVCAWSDEKLYGNHHAVPYSNRIFRNLIGDVSKEAVVGSSIFVEPIDYIPPLISWRRHISSQVGFPDYPYFGRYERNSDGSIKSYPAFKHVEQSKFISLVTSRSTFMGCNQGLFLQPYEPVTANITQSLRTVLLRPLFSRASPESFFQNMRMFPDKVDQVNKDFKRNMHALQEIARTKRSALYKNSIYGTT
jgi:hypothetical protein